jgi:hypothetical protein
MASAKKASNNKPKALTLSALKSKNKQYNATYDIDIDGYTVKIKTLWSPSKISELVEEFISKMDKYLKNQSDVQVSSAYLFLLYLRYFTDLAIPSDFSKQLEWLSELIDSGYLSQIVECLPKDQIEKVNDELEKFLDKINTVLPQLEESLQKQEFENEEVKNIALKTPSDKSE